LQPHAAEAAVNVAAVILALAAGLAVAPVAQAQSQSGPATQTGPAFKSGSSLVALNVTVTDSAAKYVSGLQPTDFVI
jgi:hypothetical protein